MVIDSGS